MLQSLSSKHNVQQQPINLKLFLNFKQNKYEITGY